MHAAANAMPMPATQPSLGAKWIRVNVLIAVTFTLTELSMIAINKVLIAPELPFFAIAWMKTIFASVLMGVNFTTYAMLTGSVLSEKLPALSRGAWIAAHLALALVLVLIMAAGFHAPASATAGSAVASTSQVDWPFTLFLILVASPVLGAAAGGLQALVLRPAARGTFHWIVGFAMAGGAIALLTTVTSIIDPMRWNSFITAAIIVASMNFVGVMLTALAMLPALKRLTPKA